MVMIVDFCVVLVAYAACFTHLTLMCRLVI